MKVLNYLLERIQRPGYAEETLLGYRECTPQYISRGRTLRRFLSDGKKMYAKLEHDERMVFLIADAEAVISTEGWNKYFIDPVRIGRTKDLINALQAIEETHTISIINNFIKEVENHNFKFESDSVARYVKEYPVVDSFWNRRFMIKSGLRWGRLKNYFIMKESPSQEGAVLLH